MEFYEYIERFMRSFGGSECLRLRHCLSVSTQVHELTGSYQNRQAHIGYDRMEAS
jgi:hypothetical protein